MESICIEVERSTIEINSYPCIEASSCPRSWRSREPRSTGCEKDMTMILKMQVRLTMMSVPLDHTPIDQGALLKEEPYQN